MSVNNLINENSEKQTQRSSWTCRIYILERGHRKEKKISAGKFFSLNHDDKVLGKSKAEQERVLLIYMIQSGKSSLFRSLRQRFEETDPHYK